MDTHAQMRSFKMHQMNGTVTKIGNSMSFDLLIVRVCVVCCAVNDKMVVDDDDDDELCVCACAHLCQHFKRQQCEWNNKFSFSVQVVSW